MKKVKQEKHSLIEVKKKKKKEMIAKAAANYMDSQLHIENKYASLISLIDTIYPPLMCTQCDTVSSSRSASNHHFKEIHKKKARYLCIHPHCEQSFISRGALRFHISRSHLVNYSRKPLPDPPFLTLNNINTTTKTIQNPPKPTSIIPPKNISPKKKIFTPRLSMDDLTPSPPPSPFSLYHSRKNSPNKKPTLSAGAENFLNTMYPPLQCPSCLQVFNRKTNVIKHLTEAHLGQEPYRCIYPKCAHPRLYATREGLVYHIVRVHDDESQVKKS